MDFEQREKLINRILPEVIWEIKRRDNRVYGVYCTSLNDRSNRLRIKVHVNEEYFGYRYIPLSLCDQCLVKGEMEIVLKILWFVNQLSRTARYRETAIG
ncbi:MAG: hypothetical protein ACYC0Q_07970 [Eubacteriales bacterium]